MKRILVATDRGRRSANALERAIQLSAASGARLRVIHAAPEADGSGLSPATRGRIVSEAQAIAAKIAACPIDISARVSSAKPADAILAAAELINADLIVLGAHGVPRFRDVLFGTTGTHVVRHADQPVLIVQNDISEPYSRALIAVDDPLVAGRILGAALDVAPASELFAVHAFSPSLRQTLAGQAVLDKEGERQQRELASLIDGAAAARQSGSRLTATTHAVVEPGDALGLIMREAKRLSPNLVVIGTRRGAALLGSHAVDTMFWCPHDVLVVPERQSEMLASPATA
ncbi:MAG: universal stress protein [Hyphomicrobiaceae bacterium]